ncbi:hypothetical protein J6590_068379, partial [Homalodisca vitripennis]
AVFSQVVTPTKTVTFDEMIIPFKGRSKAKHADGYVSEVQLYQGAPKNAQTSVLGATPNKTISQMVYGQFIHDSYLAARIKKEGQFCYTSQANHFRGADQHLGSVKDLANIGPSKPPLMFSRWGAGMARAYTEPDLGNSASNYLGTSTHLTRHSVFKCLPISPE